MSERRSHWDIDLVDGVGRRLIPLYRSIGYCTDAERHRIYTLIEFVEDWQDRTQQARAMSMTDNEAAIQRVQAVCDRRDAEVVDMDPFFRQVVLVSVDEVRDALDGAE